MLLKKLAPRWIGSIVNKCIAFNCAFIASRRSLGFPLWLSLPLAVDSGFFYSLQLLDTPSFSLCLSTDQLLLRKQKPVVGNFLIFLLLSLQEESAAPALSLPFPTCFGADSVLQNSVVVGPPPTPTPDPLGNLRLLISHLLPVSSVSRPIRTSP